MIGIPLKIYFDKNTIYTSEIEYIWSIFAQNKKIPFLSVDTPASANFILSSGQDTDLAIAVNFWSDILEKKLFAHELHFQKDCFIRNEYNQIDYLATAFYMLNSLQEYESTEVDEIGRFSYTKSYQLKFNNIQENLVQQCFDALIESNEKLKTLNSPDPGTSAFFLSHDIDSIYGSVYQDGLHVLKQGKPFIFMKLLLQHLSHQPPWLNMDKIMQIENEYQFKSAFYWLVNKGRIDKRQVNADYEIGSKLVANTANAIATHGWSNGLHKSISDMTMSAEMQRLNAAGIKAMSNRYHYLKFSVPDVYEQVSKAGLQMDASLGFADAIGFRNSYGRPFQPYNLKKRTPYPIIEVPLTIMDGTLQRYNKVQVGETANEIIEFLEKHKKGCVLSLLWHNTFFSSYKYKGYFEEYKKLIAYFYDNKFKCLLPEDLVKEYGSFESLNSK
jgi:hypothetical protein